MDNTRGGEEKPQRSLQPQGLARVRPGPRTGHTCGDTQGPTGTQADLCARHPLSAGALAGPAHLVPADPKPGSPVTPPSQAEERLMLALAQPETRARVGDGTAARAFHSQLGLHRAV